MGDRGDFAEKKGIDVWHIIWTVMGYEVEIQS